MCAEALTIIGDAAVLAVRRGRRRAMRRNGADAGAGYAPRKTARRASCASTQSMRLHILERSKGLDASKVRTARVAETTRSRRPARPLRTAEPHGPSRTGPARMPSRSGVTSARDHGDKAINQKPVPFSRRRRPLEGRRRHGVRLGGPRGCHGAVAQQTRPNSIL